MLTCCRTCLSGPVCPGASETGGSLAAAAFSGNAAWRAKLYQDESMDVLLFLLGLHARCQNLRAPLQLPHGAHMRTSILNCPYTCTYIYVHIYIYIYPAIDMCVYKYTCIYIHGCINAPPWSLTASIYLGGCKK